MKSLHHFNWRVRIQYNNLQKLCVVVPDAAFTLTDSSGEPSWFFLELDRGTMPAARKNLHQTSFLRKILAYKETRRSGVLWKRYEIPGFRVLVVTESEKRLASLQRITAECFQKGESKMFLFAALAEIKPGKHLSDYPWRTCSGASVSDFP